MPDNGRPLTREDRRGRAHMLADTMLDTCADDPVLRAELAEYVSLLVYGDRPGSSLGCAPPDSVGAQNSLALRLRRVQVASYILTFVAPNIARRGLVPASEDRPAILIDLRTKDGIAIDLQPGLAEFLCALVETRSLSLDYYCRLVAHKTVKRRALITAKNKLLESLNELDVTLKRGQPCILLSLVQELPVGRAR